MLKNLMKRVGLHKKKNSMGLARGDDPLLATAGARRSSLLEGILLALLLLLAATIVLILVCGFGTAVQRVFYASLTGGLLLCLIAAFLLNRKGLYTVSAVILITCAYIGPWASVIFSQITVSGDFIPLIFTALTIFLCAMLLSIRATIIMTVLQVLGIAVLLVIVPDIDQINWQSLVAFILFSSTLGLVYGYMHQRDYQQIEEQAKRLLENEKQLKEMTVRDALTGLFNWRYTMESLEREIARSRRTHTSIGVVIMDVDSFKEINDRFGHLAGDAVLAGIGSFLQSRIRAGDIPCRYGGDEFVLILPDALPEAVLARAEELCGEIRLLQSLPDGFSALQVTCSVGVASYPQHGETGQSLLAAADAALYRAKATGRNHVAVAEEKKQ